MGAVRGVGLASAPIVKVPAGSVASITTALTEVLGVVTSLVAGLGVGTGVSLDVCLEASAACFGCWNEARRVSAIEGFAEMISELEISAAAITALPPKKDFIRIGSPVRN